MVSRETGAAVIIHGVVVEILYTVALGLLGICICTIIAELVK
jgi:hypothetical protein